jgi:hypothetical protein
MTNRQRILTLIREVPGLTDSEIRQRTGIEPHQQVNQICRGLAADRLIRRVQGAHGRIVNVLPGTEPSITSTPTPPTPTPASPAAPREGSSRRSGFFRSRRPEEDSPLEVDADLSSMLLILPCSGRKAAGGTRGLRGPSVTEHLDTSLARRLEEARSALSGAANLDETRLLPAYQRYQGTLYSTAHQDLAAAVEQRTQIIILSGGYGILLAEEPIGTYERTFNVRDWPRGLLEECLVTVARRLGATRAVAFCARSTGYAELVRRTPWKRNGFEATLAFPELEGRGGAQVLVPRASGEAFGALLRGQLDASWRSGDGLPLATERVR